MDLADSLKALKEAGHIRDSRDDSQSETTDRLLEHSVKRGAARREHWVVSQRRLINQQRTGNVSHCTLGEILRKGLEHL